MNTEQVIRAIRAAIARHRGDEAALYERLLGEAEAWAKRLEEVEAEDRKQE